MNGRARAAKRAWIWRPARQRQMSRRRRRRRANVGRDNAEVGRALRARERRRRRPANLRDASEYSKEAGAARRRRRRRCRRLARRDPARLGPTASRGGVGAAGRREPSRGRQPGPANLRARARPTRRISVVAAKMRLLARPLCCSAADRSIKFNESARQGWPFAFAFALRPQLRRTWRPHWRPRSSRGGCERRRRIRRRQRGLEGPLSAAEGRPRCPLAARGSLTSPLA